MRSRLAGALLAAAIITSGCTGATNHPQGSPTAPPRASTSSPAPSASPTPAPSNSRPAVIGWSGFVVPPTVADTHCNAGRGLRLTSGDVRSPSVVSGVAGGRSVLAAFSQIYPDRNRVLLEAITARCRLDSGFGRGGMETVGVPAGVGSGGHGHALWIGTIAHARGGATLIGGTYRNRWILAELSADGELNPGFGNKGWVALPYRGDVTAILEEPSGRIVVAGDNAGGGCCTVNHAVALTRRGALDRTWANGGRALLPTGEDSSVTSLAREPDGRLLFHVGWGNSGCWGISLAMLDRSGRRVPGFTQRVDRFWKAQNFGTFVGDAYVDGDGFTVVGTGQPQCAQSPDTFGKNAYGVLAHFAADGTLTAHARFESQLYNDVSASKLGDDTLIAETTQAKPTYLWFTALRPDGSVDRSFGEGGRVTIRPPWRARNDFVNTWVQPVEPHVFLIAAWRYGAQVALTRVKL